MKKIIPFLLFLIFITLNVKAAGFCVLDKQQYSPGETAIFSCSCSLPNEESQSGFIVFQNSTGTILHSNPINSLNCRTSLFSGLYFFLEGQNFTGNATFSLNADGTGIPTNWGSVTDIIFDEFNVSGAHLTDCIIQFENITNKTFEVGRTLGIQLNLLDGTTSTPLVHASCHLHFLDISRLSVFHEPYTPPGDVSIETGAGGEVLFQHDLDEDIWLPNTEYLIEANCYCTPNGTAEQCYLGDGGGGTVAGFKICTGELILELGEDLREKNKRTDMVSFVLSIMILMLYFGFVGWVSLTLQDKSEQKKFSADKMNISVMFGSWSMVIIELIFMVGVLYMNQLNADLTGLLKINFWISIIIGFGLGMIVMIMLTISLFNFRKQIDQEGFNNTKGW